MCMNLGKNCLFAVLGTAVPSAPEVLQKHEKPLPIIDLESAEKAKAPGVSAGGLPRWAAHGRKPNSVPEPQGDPGRSFLWDCRHRQPHARHPFHPADHGCPAEAGLGTACACTRWGLPCPASCLVGRCALTAPFHPCRPSKRGRRSVLCGTFPDSQPEPVGVAHHRVLSCSDFPPRCPAPERSPFHISSIRHDAGLGSRSYTYHDVPRISSSVIFSRSLARSCRLGHP